MHRWTESLESLESLEPCDCEQRYSDFDGVFYSCPSSCASCRQPLLFQFFVQCESSLAAWQNLATNVANLVMLTPLLAPLFDSRNAAYLKEYGDITVKLYEYRWTGHTIQFRVFDPISTANQCDWFYDHIASYTLCDSIS